MSAPRIRCAICGTPVQRVEWLDDSHTNERVIRAYCHGSRDEMRLRMADLESQDLVQQLEAGEGLAFQSPLQVAA